MKKEIKFSSILGTLLIVLFSCSVQETDKVQIIEESIIETSFKRDLKNFDSVSLNGTTYTMHEVLTDQSLFAIYQKAMEFTIFDQNPRELIVSTVPSEALSKSDELFSKKGYTFVIKLFSGNNLDGDVRRVNYKNLKMRAGGIPYLIALPEAASNGNNSAIVKFKQLQLCAGSQEGKYLAAWFNFFSTTGGSIGAKIPTPENLKIVMKRSDFDGPGSFNEFNLNKYRCMDIQ